MTLNYNVVDGNGYGRLLMFQKRGCVVDAPDGTATAVLSEGSEDTPCPAELLQGLNDIDGDTLSVSNLVSSSGTVMDNNRLLVISSEL